MLGWRLFRHAVLMILQNLQEAVKLLIAPMVIMVLGAVAGLAVLMVAGLPFEAFM
ncbi:MAG: hypothetical protein HRU31_04240, partial [Rhodobacteraceae bacterium]|nr:hypothetical protein [Paracoccaceae bacterium]